MARLEHGNTGDLWSLIDEDLISSISSYDNRCFLQFGAFGRRVETARDRNSGKMVVLKRVQLSRLVCSEVRILRRVKARTARLLGVCPDPSENERAHQPTGPPPDSRYLCIVMQYGGRDIRDSILRVPVQSTIRGILEAVGYLHHSKDIAHLDLKPENILMDDQSRVKIIDFGFAMELDAETGEGLLCHHCGSYGYHAPEILLGPHPNLKAADMWSVGCILLEMMVTDPDAMYDLTGSVSPLSGSPAQYLRRVVNLCGSINESSFPGCSELRRFSRYKDYNLITDREKKVKTRLETFVHPLPLDLIDSLLTLDPKRRITACLALEHELFARPADSPDIQRKQAREPHPLSQSTSRGHCSGTPSNSNSLQPGSQWVVQRRQIGELSSSKPPADTKPWAISHVGYSLNSWQQAMAPVIVKRITIYCLLAILVLLVCVLWRSV